MTTFQMKRLSVGAALLASSFFAGGAAASAQAVSYPPGAVVQSLSEDPGSALTRHLRDLNTSPRSLTSLLGAGNAALAVGDPQTALTFFARAEEVAPRDGRIKAGMGSAFVQTEQAQAALKFFSEAVSLGAPVSSFAKDRGLAYDMIGDPARAQADYAIALQFGRDPEVERRLALSRAISGDREGALAVIEPQVRRGDRAGYRARAFVLALTGDAVGAAKAVEAVMPAQANAMRPFLALLPQLGNADQAMAVHFGRFPANAQAAIGANRQYAQNQSASAPGQTASPTPVNAGAPDASQPALGSRGGTAIAQAKRQNSRSRQQSARSARSEQRVNSLIRVPQPASNAASGGRLSAQELAAITQPRTQAVTTVNQPLAAQSPPVQSPPTILSQLGQQQAAALPAETPPLVAAEPVQTAQLAPSAAALEPPAARLPSPAAPAETASAQSQSSARITDVDFGDVIEAVQGLSSPISSSPPQERVELAQADVPAKAAPKPAAKPEQKKTQPPATKEPSRIWVQLAAAQNKSAFPDEFKRLKRKAAKPLASQTAWTAPLGRTNRLLVGPFKTEKEARDLVNELSKVEIASYSWVSDAGEKVEKLPAK